ncbi:MAG: flagellar hook-associated protein FlgK [Campylobacterales bacterium]
MSLFRSLHTGTSGLFTSQAAIDVTSNNIANANNENYTRQRAIISSNPPMMTTPGQIGTGSQVTHVVRVHDELIYGRYRDISSQLEFYSQQKSTLEEVSTYFPDLDNSGLMRDMNAFFESWRTFASNSTNSSQKIALAQNTQNFATSLQDTRERLKDLQRSLNEQIKPLIDEVNSTAERIAMINRELDRVEANGIDHGNDLRDERDRLEMNLAKIIGSTVSKVPYVSDTTTGSIETKLNYVLHVGGYNLIDGGNFHPIQVKANEAADFYQLLFEYQNLETVDISSKIMGGKLGAILDLRGRQLDPNGVPIDGKLQRYIDSIDIFASGLISSVNNIYAQSARDVMSSNMSERNLTITYSYTGTSQPSGSLNAGDLALEVYMKDPADGYFKWMTVSSTLTGAYGTAENLANAINNDPTLSNYVKASSEKGKLVLESWQDMPFKIVLNGTAGVATGLTGSPIPTTITVDRALNATDLKVTKGSFDVVLYDDKGTEVGRRTISVDPDTDSVINVIERINAHQDDNHNNNALDDIEDILQASYVGGEVTISVREDQDENGAFKYKGRYTFALIDSSSEPTNMISALGLGRFFDGKNAEDIRLTSELAEDYAKISAYGPAIVGDNQVANAIQELQYREITFFDRNKRPFTDTLEGYYRYTQSLIAVDANSVNLSYETTTALHETAKTSFEEVSRVSIDEEMTNLIRFQTGYSAAAKLITTIDQMLNTLLGMKQ